jgi:hypothetical protein
MPRTQSPKDLKEAAVDRQVKDFMLLRGWRCIRFQRTVIPGAFQTGEPGIPDRMYVKYLDKAGVCVAVWIELKRAKRGKLSEQQQKWRDREIARGAVVLEVNDIDVFEKEYETRFGWLHEGRFAKSAAHQTRLGLEEEF